MITDRATMDDGCRIAYEFRERPDAPIVMLSPSLGTAMAMFDQQYSELCRHYSVLRYDPRGHGASDVPPGGYSLDRLGRDAVQLLDHLGLEQTHFLGVSLGGMTGQWLGYRAPERIGKLILANTSAYMGPPSGWTDRIRTVSANGMQAISEAVLERWFTPSFREASPAEVGRIGSQLLATDPAGYAGCCAAIRDMDLRSVVGRIGRPTLVIAGRYDPATPPDHAAFLSREIAGSALVELGTAHLANCEQPGSFNAVMLEFLQG